MKLGKFNTAPVISGVITMQVPPFKQGLMAQLSKQDMPL